MTPKDTLKALAAYHTEGRGPVTHEDVCRVMDAFRLAEEALRCEGGCDDPDPCAACVAIAAIRGEP